MAKRSETRPQLRPASVLPAAIPEAIRKLERRLQSLKQVDPRTNQSDNFVPLAESLVTPLNTTIVEIFQPNTIEAERAQVQVDDFLMQIYYDGLNQQDRIDAFNSGLMKARGRVETELAILRERLEDGTPDATTQALRAYSDLDLHPDVNAAASQLFRDGHYANAIEDAVKALNALVRYRSGLELDGSTLMEAAFSPKNPVLSFNDLADQSDLDEQRGFMQMFSGAVAGLRNPRAHKLIKDDPERALEFIAFVSLLAKLVTSAKRLR